MKEVGGIFYLTAIGLGIGVLCLIIEQGIKEKCYKFK